MASWQHIFSGRPDDSFRPCSSRSTSAAPTCMLSSYYRSAPFSLSVNCFSRRTGLPIALVLRCFPAAVGTTELPLPASSGTVPVGWVLAGALTSLSAGSSFSGFRHVSLDQFAASSCYSLYAAISPRLVPDRGYFLKSYDRLVVTLLFSMDFRREPMVERPIGSSQIVSSGLRTAGSLQHHIPWSPCKRIISSGSLPVALTCVPVCSLTLLSFPRLSAAYRPALRSCSLGGPARLRVCLGDLCYYPPLSLGAVPVQLLATGFMFVPRCRLRGTIYMVTSARSLSISSRRVTVSLFPASSTLLVSPIFISVGFVSTVCSMMSSQLLLGRLNIVATVSAPRDIDST